MTASSSAGRRLPGPLASKNWKYVFGTYTRNPTGVELDPAPLVPFRRGDVDEIFLSNKRILVEDEKFTDLGGIVRYWVVAGKLADGRYFYMQSGFVDTPAGEKRMPRALSVQDPWSWGTCSVALDRELFLRLAVWKPMRSLVEKGMEWPKWKRRPEWS